MDYHQLVLQRRSHPAWRLLAADHAPMIASFLHRSFVAPNMRTIPRQELAAQLDDRLYQLHEAEGQVLYPKSATAYLDDWASDERGWLRKYYPPGQDEPHYDLTSPAEQAIEWLDSLGQRAFIGTESRLMTVFDLLKQIVDGTELNPRMRIEELLETRVEGIFLTENEVNALAFPPVKAGMVVFGGGYGIERTAQAGWLSSREVL